LAKLDHADFELPLFEASGVNDIASRLYRFDQGTVVFINFIQGWATNVSEDNQVFEALKSQLVAAP
jgi:hypothetical protein